MTQQKKIVMQFDVFGQSHLDAVGFVGGSCKEATANYLRALNPDNKDDQNKPEFSQPNTAGATVTSRW
jgi:hypothetical protein